MICNFKFLITIWYFLGSMIRNNVTKVFLLLFHRGIFSSFAVHLLNNSIKYDCDSTFYYTIFNYFYIPKFEVWEGCVQRESNCSVITHLFAVP